MIARTLPAITLYQPYASLIVGGSKLYETRSWPAPAKYIGERIAIHAAKARTRAVADAIGAAYGFRKPLPFGAIVGEATIENVAQVIGHDVNDGWLHVRWAIDGSLDEVIPPSDQKHGDFSIGRYAWKLIDIERYDPPIAARGWQGFWIWESP